MTKIRRCGKLGCVSEYQDKRYGEGRRVFNSCKDLDRVGHRCTVCGQCQTFKGDTPKESKK